MIRELKVIFNECLQRKEMPNKWLVSSLILLFKKGDKYDLKNYRPISLLCVFYKLYMGIIAKRIEKSLDSEQPVEQAGFRRNYSTCDHIFVLKHLLNYSIEYNFDTILLFVDFEKAFDNILTEAILTTLEQANISNEYIQIVKNVYGRSEMVITLEGRSEKIKLEKGLKQGDVTSSMLFNAVLEYMFRTLDWSHRGININGENLNHLRFADDVVIIGKDINEVTEMLKELVDAAIKVGLKINFSKCKYLTSKRADRGSISVGEQQIGRVDDFIYLGHRLSIDGQTHEVSRRIGLGWAAYNKFRYLFRAEIEINLKVRLWNMCVLPCLIYGSETWTLDALTIKKLRVAVRGMERSMIGINRRDRKTNKWIREKTGLRDVGEIVHTRKWSWMGHIIRTTDNRWTKRLIEWWPINQLRNRGRPKTSYDHEMKKVCGENTWRRVALDRKEWQRMGKVYASVWLKE